MICPSVCPLDQAEVIAARTAALPFVTPLAKDATRLGARPFDPGVELGFGFVRTIAWNAAIVSRASTSKGTPPSIAAMVIVSDFDRISRPVVMSRAIVLAEGVPMQAFNVGFFGTPAAAGPFGDNPQTTAKTPVLQTPPKFTAISKARISRDNREDSAPFHRPQIRAGTAQPQPVELLDDHLDRR